MLNQILTQQDIGPLEPINTYIEACGNPQKAIIGIGATSYTKYGETAFLQANDEILVVIYDRKHYSIDAVTEKLETKQYDNENMSVLAQNII